MARKVSEGAKNYLRRGMDAERAEAVWTVAFARPEGPFRPSLTLPLILALLINIIGPPLNSTVSQIAYLASILAIASVIAAFERRSIWFSYNLLVSALGRVVIEIDYYKSVHQNSIQQRRSALNHRSLKAASQQRRRLRRLARRIATNTALIERGERTPAARRLSPGAAGPVFQCSITPWDRSSQAIAVDTCIDQLNHLLGKHSYLPFAPTTASVALNDDRDSLARLRNWVREFLGLPIVITFISAALTAMWTWIGSLAK